MALKLFSSIFVLSLMVGPLFAVDPDMASGGKSSAGAGGSASTLSPRQGASDTSKDIHYITVGPVDGEKETNPRGTKTFENNMPSFKFGKILAAGSLTLVLLGLVFLVSFMRRKSRKI